MCLMDQPPSWCCPALHHLPGSVHQRPGRRALPVMVGQIKALEEVQCMLPEPGGKRVLRCAQVLERALEIMPLQVKDRQFPLRRVLEIQAIHPPTPTPPPTQPPITPHSPTLPP